MRRIIGAAVVGLMAAVATGGQRGEVVVGVALVARQGDVRSGEREAGGVVVECCRVPAAGGVALRAIRREARCDVIGICGGGEVLLVTGVAGSWSGRVVVVGVALRAGQRGMHAGKGIVGVKRVIKGGIEPVGGVVAGAAVMREIDLDVGWIDGGDEILLVAREARGRRSLEDVVDVACRAGQSEMAAGEGVPGHLEVVKPCVEPGVHGVAGFTRSGEAGRCVVEDRSLEVLLMAGVAGGGEADELAGRGVLVAVLALQQRMRADERETVLVILNLGGGNLPAIDGVAFFAVCAELAVMNVGVAIGALRAHLAEDEACVAPGAVNLLVHAAQRITGVIVIELRMGADWFPTGVCMAILTGKGDGAVRIGYLGLWPTD